MKKQIFELFGFLVNDKSEKAERFRKECLCPFYGGLCDGGGNRYQTFLNQNTVKKNNLADYFDSAIHLVPPGVCSLHVKDTKWIVCPRRVFSFSENPVQNYHSSLVKKIIDDYCKLIPNTKTGIWSEIKIKYADSNSNDESKSFDYTFDYIVASVAPKKLAEVADEEKVTEKRLKALLEKKGQALGMRNKEIYMENYPTGPLNIVEVMTSSTSGGNKKKGTTIQQSFINAIKGEEHESPGINYRQVWARMVSQLIVKSQIGDQWGSRTLWVLQDSLVNYMSKSTDLNLQKLISEVAKEVNLVSMKFSDEVDENGCLKLELDHLYAGKIPQATDDTDFNKLLLASIIPEMAFVRSKLLLKKPKSII